MLTTHKSVISTTLFSSQCIKVKVKKKNINGETRISMAKKDDFSEKSTTNSSLKVIVSQVAVSVLGLGFIDAGYSGDWSRIGVISKETEDLLKVVAFLVIPLCFFIVYSISKGGED